MKKLRIDRRTAALLLSGFVLVSSSAGLAKAKSDDCYLNSEPVIEIFEDESICNLTTIDEEMANGTIDIFEKEEEFRKKIIELNYYASSGETDSYNETLRWLRDNFKDTATGLLLISVKGAIAEEENKSTSDIQLTPGPDYNEDSLFLTPEGVAGVKNDYKTEGYTIKSKALNNAVNLCANIQDMNFEEISAEDMIKLFDEVTDTSKMAIASGASRHDDKIVEKNSKKYIKKNFNIK